jgi:hypothetical protein
LKTAVAARVIAAAANVTRLKDLASLAVVAAVTLVVGVLNHSFPGFPKGYDAFGHMSKIKLLVDYFPNADWNHEWYAGMLFSEGSFPALFHYIGALLVVVLGISTATALVVISAASFVVIGWGPEASALLESSALQASPATGVLFKESWFANWHASINGSSAPVYEAEPDFMDLPLGKSVTYPAQITIEFTRSAGEWLGDGVSIVAMAGLLAYALAGVRRLRWRRRRVQPSASH